MPDTKELEALLEKDLLLGISAAPWSPGHLGRSDTTCQCRYVFSEAYMGAVCSVYVDDGAGGDDPPRAEAIANLHLIAAAPHLLLALKMVLLEIERNARDVVWSLTDAGRAILASEQHNG